MNKEDTEHKKFDVFISYASEDSSVAKSIADLCKERGWSAWFDQVEIEVENNIHDKIADAIEKCEFVIVLVSNNSLKSKWISREWDVLCEEKWSRPDIKILPVNLDNAKSPPFLFEYEDIRLNRNNFDYKLLKERFSHILDLKNYSYQGKSGLAEQKGEEIKRLKDRIDSIKLILTQEKSDDQGGQEDDQT